MQHGLKSCFSYELCDKITKMTECAEFNFLWFYLRVHRY